MTDGYTLAYLLPRPTALQVVERAEVEVDPTPDERAEHIDVFGNRVLQIGVHRAHETLTLLGRERGRSSSRAACRRGASRGRSWRCASAELRGGDALAVRPFAGSSPYVPLERHGAALRALAEEAFTPHRPVVDGARDLCHLIYETFEYDPSFTEVSTPLSAVLEGRRGVCQDFAHLADRVPALARARRALRQRVHRDRSAARADRLDRRRRVARLVLGVGAPAGLDRLRPDERPPPDAPPRDGRLGPRLRRRRPGPRRRHRSGRRPDPLRRGRRRACACAGHRDAAYWTRSSRPR